MSIAVFNIHKIKRTDKEFLGYPYPSRSLNKRYRAFMTVDPAELRVTETSTDADETPLGEYGSCCERDTFVNREQFN